MGNVLVCVKVRVSHTGNKREKEEDKLCVIFRLRTLTCHLNTLREKSVYVQNSGFFSFIVLLDQVSFSQFTKQNHQMHTH